MRLRGKVAVITGSGSGRVTALRIAAEGASVVAADVDDVANAAVVGEVTAAGGAAVAETPTRRSSRRRWRTTC